VGGNDSELKGVDRQRDVCLFGVLTYLGSTSSPDMPALMLYAPLSRMSTGVDIVVRYGG